MPFVFTTPLHRRKSNESLIMSIEYFSFVEIYSDKTYICTYTYPNTCTKRQCDATKVFAPTHASRKEKTVLIFLMDIDLFFIWKMYGEKQHLLCRLYYLLDIFGYVAFIQQYSRATAFLRLKTPFAFVFAMFIFLFHFGKIGGKTFSLHVGQNTKWKRFGSSSLK